VIGHVQLTLKVGRKKLTCVNVMASVLEVHIRSYTNI